MSGRDRDAAHVFAGGGIAGLIGALLFSERRPDARIVVVEKEAEIGGLLRSFDYGEFGRFDYGMHNFHETGIAELDRLIDGLLPPGEWQIMGGNQRDLAGVFFRGRVQQNSPYIDLRSSAPADIDRYVAGFFRAAGEAQPTAAGHAGEVARARFGASIADECIAPILQKLYRRAPEQLDPVALKITSLGRVIMFDDALMADLMRSPHIRGLLAFPEQRNLPAEYVPSHRMFYPKQYGMHRVIAALVQRLQARRVDIRTGTQVQAVETGANRVTRVVLSRDGRREAIDDVAGLYWTAGLQFLAPMLLDPMPAVRFERGARTVVVNCLTDKPLSLGDLFYFYCYDAGFDAFRLTNYTGYCDGAPRAGGYPFSLEMLDYDGKDAETLRRQALDEIGQFKVLAPGSAMIFSRAEILTSGFPLPSRVNMNSLSTLRHAIGQRKLDNLHLMGILAEPELFFQGDVLRHAYRTVERAVVQ